MSRARPLKDIIAGAGCVAAPGVYDALSARIIDQLGFEAVYLGGNALGLGRAKGQPFVNLTDTVEATALIARTIKGAVVVDAGAGFGDAAHVYEAVREIAAAGAAAIHIDDQPYPKAPAYHRGQGTLADLEVVERRIKTARKALGSDSDVMLIARTDALRVAKSADEAIARGRALAEAGADALMVLDLGPDQAPAIAQALPDVPLVWIGGVAAPIPSLAQLKAAGFVLALYPFNTVAAVAAAVADTWSDFSETGRVNVTPDMLTRMKSETLDIVDMKTFWTIEDESR